MADVKISQLPAGTANANAVVPATNAAGTTTQKVTMGAIAALGGGPPAAHKASHSTGGADALTAADIGAASASHTHGNITNDGRIGTTSGQLVMTGTGGSLSAVADTKSAFASVATYAAMLALGTPSVMTVCRVTSDENKGASNTIYQIWPNGVRLWMAALAD